MKYRIINKNYVIRGFQKLYKNFFKHSLFRNLIINPESILSVLFNNSSSNLIDHTHTEF